MKTKPSPAADRLPEFRSWARDITHKARIDRTYGGATDVNGQLARAMERAYQRGYEDAQTGKDTVAQEFNCDPLDPRPVPRSRINTGIYGAFHSIGLAKFGTRDYPHSEECLALYVQDTHISSYTRKKPDWYLAHSRIGRDNVSDRTIQQLIKLGILVPAKSNHPDLQGLNLVMLSPKGDATYRALRLDP